MKPSIMPGSHQAMFVTVCVQREIGAPPPIFSLITVRPPKWGKPSFPYANYHQIRPHPLLHIFGLLDKCNSTVVSKFLSNFHFHHSPSVSVPKCCLTLQTVHATRHPKSVTAVTGISNSLDCCTPLSSVWKLSSPSQNLQLVDVSLCFHSVTIFYCRFT